MNRVATGLDIFASDADCELFLAGIAEASGRYATEVHAYCLMSNHFHLLLRSREGRVSEFMRFVVGRFTRMHNLRLRTDGAVFRCRFVSKLIDSEAHLLECVRYIHLNPIEAGLAKTPEAWAWSSAAAYATRTDQPAWLVTNELLAMFGPIERDRYRQFLDDGLALLQAPHTSDGV